MYRSGALGFQAVRLRTLKSEELQLSHQKVALFRSQIRETFTRSSECVYLRMSRDFGPPRAVSRLPFRTCCEVDQAPVFLMRGHRPQTVLNPRDNPLCLEPVSLHHGQLSVCHFNTFSTVNTFSRLRNAPGYSERCHARDFGDRWTL